METTQYATAHKFDFLFVVMGLLFFALAVGEYWSPSDVVGDRLPIKLVCGFQIVVGMLGAIAGLSSARLWHPIPASLSLLCLWLCAAAILNATDAVVALSGCLSFLHWYTIFLFCYVRSQADPRRIHLFLVILASSLFVWMLAQANSVDLTMESEHLADEARKQCYLGYYMVALLPYALLFRNKTLKVASVVLIAIGTVYSLKRGAIVALLLMGLASSFVHVAVLRSDALRTYRVLAVIAVWAVGVLAAGLLWWLDPAPIERRFAEGDTGRTAIYAATLDRIGKSGPVELLIGHGHGEAEATTGSAPHNDWLYLQHDFGALGVLLMLVVYVSLLLFLRRLCREQSALALPLTCSIVLLGCVQMYSTGICIKIAAFITGGIGMVAGCWVPHQTHPEGWPQSDGRAWRLQQAWMPQDSRQSCGQ